LRYSIIASSLGERIEEKKKGEGREEEVREGIECKKTEKFN
jgi:hypothetical protein